MSREFTIGRDDAKRADILLSGAHISGLHAAMKIDPRGYLWIRDTNSMNGTWVLNKGSKRIVSNTYMQVHSGETISLGGVEYSVNHLFGLLPSTPAPQEDAFYEKSQAMVRCVHCGTPTPMGKPCKKCKK